MVYCAADAGGSKRARLDQLPAANLDADDPIDNDDDDVTLLCHS